MTIMTEMMSGFMLTVVLQSFKSNVQEDEYLISLGEGRNGIWMKLYKRAETTESSNRQKSRNLFEITSKAREYC